MPDTKISALPSAGTVSPADVFPIVQGGVTKQSPFSNLWEATAVGNGNYTILATDVFVYTSVAFTGAHVWTLPSASAYVAGRLLRIADIFGTITVTNTLSVQRGGTDTIQGAAGLVVLNSPRSSIILLSDGVSNWLIAGRSPSVNTIFLTSGTGYTPSIGVKALFVECVGGGGAGGGAALCSSQTSVGAGGGAGAYSATSIDVPKTSYSYAIGAGGTGVSGAGGNNGGDTTFDSPSVCTAKGGVGGGIVGPITTLNRAGGVAGGAGGSGVGDFTASGGTSGSGITLSSTQGWSGQGGASLFGTGGTGTITIGGGSAGGSGQSFGSGGGGSATSGTAATGGAGAAGCIRVTEYF